MDSVLDQRINDVVLQVCMSQQFVKFPTYVVQVEVKAVFDDKPKFRCFIQTLDDLIDYIAYKLIGGMV